jgi:hypothetical protein
VQTATPLHLNGGRLCERDDVLLCAKSAITLTEGVVPIAGVGFSDSLRAFSTPLRYSPLSGKQMFVSPFKWLRLKTPNRRDQTKFVQ